MNAIPRCSLWGGSGILLPYKHSAGGEVSHSIINVGTQNQNKKTFILVLKQGFMVYRDTLGLRTGSSMLPPTS